MAKAVRKPVKNELLPDLRKLVDELIRLSADVASLEDKETLAGIRRVKRGLIDHEKATKEFKGKIDALRDNL